MQESTPSTCKAIVVKMNQLQDTKNGNLMYHCPRQQEGLATGKGYGQL